MNILLDFGAIKTGGGAQLGVNFLEQFDLYSTRNCEITLLVPSIGALANKTISKSLHRITAPNSAAARMFFEYGALQRYMEDRQIHRIFTFFGMGLPHKSRIRSIVTVAYPIICYPESPYWRHISTSEKVIKIIKNAIRIRRLREANHIIAETECMARRLAHLLGPHSPPISVIPPAPSVYIQDIGECRASKRNAFHLLFLSGNDAHKNLWRLYDVARALIKRRAPSFCFLLTITHNDFVKRLNRSAIDPNILEVHFKFLGPLAPEAVMDAYRHADAMVNISDLESFSNNYMEAWVAGLPIIASDRDFSRAICGDSAVYVEPHDIDSIAEQMLTVMENCNLRSTLVENGKRKLSVLPTQERRFRQVWELIVGS